MPDAQARNIVERLEVRYREIATYCAVHPSSDITMRAPEHMALYQDAIAEIDRLTKELEDSRAALRAMERFCLVKFGPPPEEPIARASLSTATGEQC